eukprot:756283-Hanusia_phi.AAC.1
MAASGLGSDGPITGHGTTGRARGPGGTGRGTAAFAELRLIFLSGSLLSLRRQFESFRTSSIVPELPAPDLLIK